MKILELRFKNLNSLQGEWIIDFTDPEYTNNGIFALTGPTGAGKSTILDAICLALYGRTPRLEKITQSANEIMSRQTGECYAEVVFESQAGQYRCHWQQRRARSKSDGKLQDPKHEIGEADSGKIIEDKKSRVIGIIENKTGMNFDRFSRSILLAQGSFDGFLKANIGDKSEVLEQITGTEIYTDISKRVHEKSKQEQNSLELLQAKVSGIQVLSQEEVNNVTNELEEKKQLVATLKLQVDSTKASILWLKNIEQLQSEIINIEQEKVMVQDEMLAFEPEKKRLELANRAAVLDSQYTKLKIIRATQAKEQSNLSAEEQQLPSIQLASNQQHEIWNTAVKKLKQLQEEQLAMMPLWKQVRALDTQMTHQKNEVEQLDQESQGIERVLKQLYLDLELNANQHMSQKDSLAKVQDYLMKHQQDKWLVSHFAGVEVHLGQIKAQKNAMDTKEKQIQDAQNSIHVAQETFDLSVLEVEKGKQAVAQADINFKQETEQLEQVLQGKLLREYRQEKEALQREQILLHRIASYEEERQKLVAGKECPVCGSLDHPFAVKSIPMADEVDEKITTLSKLIDVAETKAANCQNLEREKDLAHHKLTLQEASKQQAYQSLEDIQRGLMEKQAEHLALQTELLSAQNNLQIALKPLGIEDTNDADKVLSELSMRLEKWRQYQEQEHNIEKALNAFLNESNIIQVSIEDKKAELSKQQVKLTDVQDNLNNVIAKREELFSQRSVDEAEEQFRNAIVSASSEEQAANALYHDYSQQFNSIKQRIHSLKQSISERASELKLLEQEFVESLLQQNFRTESDFLAANLASEERESLHQKDMMLTQKNIEIKARYQDRQSQLEAERAKKLTNLSLVELAASFQPLEAAFEMHHKEFSQLEFKLSENIKNQSLIKNQQNHIEKQKQECQRWNELHGLIGSADGKKYRNFAQGLTFESMVIHANKQLTKMTDRYLLVRDRHEPLELNVIDHYQAGEIRSTKNLSGGESFIISLALALGLSKMASQKVRVDSLFLDEGFGTLDEEALEIALEALANLHGEGKLIGVISHVSALKDRIATQIKVIPKSGGRSILNGPGVVIPHI